MPEKLKKSVPTEDQEQMHLKRWLDIKGIKFYAIPNGGKRNLSEAVKFKLMGVSAGVPDICIPIPSGPYHACYIELKRTKNGIISHYQAEWLAFLREKGNYAQVAYGSDEAKEMILHYLSFTKPDA